MPLQYVPKLRNEEIREAHQHCSKPDANAAQAIGVDLWYYQKYIKLSLRQKCRDAQTSDFDNAGAQPSASESNSETEGHQEEPNSDHTEEHSSTKEPDRKPNKSFGFARGFSKLLEQLDFVHEQFKLIDKLCLPNSVKTAVEEFCADKNYLKYVLCNKDKTSRYDKLARFCNPKSPIGYLRYLIYETGTAKKIATEVVELGIVQLKHCAYIVGPMRCQMNDVSIKKDTIAELSEAFVSIAEAMLKVRNLTDASLENNEVVTLTKTGECLYNINKYNIMYNISISSGADREDALRALAEREDMCKYDTVLNTIVGKHQELEATYNQVCDDSAVAQKVRACLIGEI